LLELCRELCREPSKVDFQAKISETAADVLGSGFNVFTREEYESCIIREERAVKLKVLELCFATVSLFRFVRQPVEYRHH
jgi:hypothetical protein